MRTLAVAPDTADLRPPPILTGKRMFDILMAACGLILLTPLLAIIALMIRLDSAGTIFFRQVRIGRAGKPFRIVKFRSMSQSAPDRGPSFTAAGDPRITRIGALLRTAKLDELPQLFNVLVGDMSLVGPRPEVPDLFAYYSPTEQADFCAIRPGITDYASLLFRDEDRLLAQAADPAAYYRQRLMPIKHELCLRYLAEMSFWTDIKIIVATLFSMVLHRVPESLIEPRIFDWRAGPPLMPPLSAASHPTERRRASA